MRSLSLILNVFEITLNEYYHEKQQEQHLGSHTVSPGLELATI